VNQFQAFCLQCVAKKIDASDVAAGSVEACDQTKLDGITAVNE
jgi:hypothetical protein